MIQEKNKGKKKWIVLTIFLILLAVIVFFAVKNLENIKALYKGLTTDTTQIGMLIQQNQKDTVGALSNSGINVSEEDFKKFNEGNLSEEEISEIIFNSMSSGSSQTADNNNQEENANENASAEGSQDADNQTSESNSSSVSNNSQDSQNSSSQSSDSSNNSGTTQNNQTTSSASGNSSAAGSSQTNTNTASTPSGALSEDEYNKKVADLVAKIYVIKGNFLALLSEFENKIISDYKALPSSQQTNAKKAQIVADNMSYIAGLEAQCDAQVKAVTDELTALMKAQGKDTSLVDAINKAYAQEKELKKAYYISLYK